MEKQSLIKASIILASASILSKVLGVFFRWPLIMLIGDEGLGYYQMTYPLYMFVLAMAAGVPVAISKIVAEKNTEGDVSGIFEVVKESTILMLLIGVGTALILFLFAKPIITFLQWDMKSYYALIGISLAPLIISLMTVYRGLFQGLQNMYPTGVSQIIEQIGRVVVGVGLAILLLPKGIEYAAGGAAFGAVAGGLGGGIYLYIKYRKLKKDLGIKKVKTNTDILNRILKMAVPISIGSTAATVMSLIDSIMVPQKLTLAGFTVEQATTLYGQLTGKATVLTNIPMTLSLALCTSLIPVIAENLKNNKKKVLNEKVQLAYKLGSVISFPSTVGLFLLAEPIMKLIFPGKYEGAMILQYLALSIPFIIITQVTTAILQGTGHYIRPVINVFIGCIVKIILTSVLVPMPELNVYGAIIGSISAYLIASLLNVISLKKKMNVRPGFYDSLIKPAIAAGVMSIIVILTYYYVWQSTYNNVYSCLSAIFLGIIIYGIAILSLRVFTVRDVINKVKRK